MYIYIYTKKLAEKRTSRHPASPSVCPKAEFRQVGAGMFRRRHCRAGKVAPANKRAKRRAAFATVSAAGVIARPRRVSKTKHADERHSLGGCACSASPTVGGLARWCSRRPPSSRCLRTEDPRNVMPRCATPDVSISRLRPQRRTSPAAPYTSLIFFTPRQQVVQEKTVEKTATTCSAQSKRQNHQPDHILRQSRRRGDGPPPHNLYLATALQVARAHQMPKATLETALKKSCGCRRQGPRGRKM
ncbi:hypothetical protein DFJ77DRAFT_164006 [Powellomyces hirtus]|nr:hypothetical protein DFJ77DRAFT_164006 [Powellomyces hirtus]